MQGMVAQLLPAPMSGRKPASGVSHWPTFPDGVSQTLAPVQLAAPQQKIITADSEHMPFSQRWPAGQSQALVQEIGLRSAGGNRSGGASRSSGMPLSASPPSEIPLSSGNEGGATPSLHPAHATKVNAKANRIRRIIL